MNLYTQIVLSFTASQVGITLGVTLLLAMVIAAASLFDSYMRHKHTIRSFTADLLDSSEIGVVRFIGEHPIGKLIKAAAAILRRGGSKKRRQALIRELREAGACTEIDASYPPRDPVEHVGAAAIFALEGYPQMVLTEVGDAAFAYSNEVTGQSYPYLHAKKNSLLTLAKALSQLQRRLGRDPLSVLTINALKEDEKILDTWHSRIDQEFEGLLRF